MVRLIEQVRLSWSDDPKTTMTVTWQSREPLSNPVVQYGEGKELTHSVSAERIRYLQETGALYTATLRGLTPGAEYTYRAGDASQGWSEMRTFRTAPARAERFIFTAFADHGVTDAARQNVRRVLAGEKPAFHLIPGDFGYAGGRQRVWDRWLEILEPLASQVPVMVCPGNHEYEPRYGISTYLARFVLPGMERYYRFDYANTRVVMFDSVTYGDREQLRWLEGELGAARRDRNVRWLILCMHHPLYSSTVGRLNDGRRIRVLEPLIDRYCPDLVLLGHNHNYERTYPLRRGYPLIRKESPFPQGLGPVFVTVGGGGHSLYPFVSEQRAFSARREQCYHYLRATVSDRSLKVEVFRTTNNALLDRFEIVR